MLPRAPFKLSYMHAPVCKNCIEDARHRSAEFRAEWEAEFGCDQPYPEFESRPDYPRPCENCHRTVHGAGEHRHVFCCEVCESPRLCGRGAPQAGAGPRHAAMRDLRRNLRTATRRRAVLLLALPPARLSQTQGRYG
jgi:hypothetical protein